jgi:aspartate racemase
MKTIGMIGGMSWESSALYYRLINQEVKARLGGHHNARSLMFTVDFHEIEALQVAGRWDALGEQMAQAARRLEAGGADLIVLCTNTLHKVADVLTAATALPFLHIADATAQAIKASTMRTVGLLGTRYTMEEGFYVGRFEALHGINTVLPDAAEREFVHRAIFAELTHGVFLEETRAEFLRIIASLVDRGAEGVVLGCTEIPLLVSQADATAPLFDSARIHALHAVDVALGNAPA